MMMTGGEHTDTSSGRNCNTASFSDSDIVTTSSMCDTNKSNSNTNIVTTPRSDMNDDSSSSSDRGGVDQDDESSSSDENADVIDTPPLSSTSHSSTLIESLGISGGSGISNTINTSTSSQDLNLATFNKEFMSEVSTANTNITNARPISLTMSHAPQMHDDDEAQEEEIKEIDTTPKSLDEILQEYKEIYNYLYVGNLNDLFGLQYIQLNDNQRIRCLGFDESIQLSVGVQKYFQYQIIEFESETDILSITKQFDHFSQLILGRSKNTPVVIHECCFGLILSSIYLIKYELFSLPQANDLIGYNDFFGTSKKHSHYQKVDSCTLIGDVTTYYYRNMTKRSQTPKKAEIAAAVVEEEPPIKKKSSGSFLKKLFITKNNKQEKEMTKVGKETKQRSNSTSQQPTSTSSIKKTNSQPQMDAGGVDNDSTPDVEIHGHSAEDSQRQPPIIASCYAELPEEYKEIIKKWSMKQTDIETHWEVSLSLLHFQTKLRFYSSQQAVTESTAKKDKRNQLKKELYLAGTPFSAGTPDGASTPTISRIPAADYSLPKDIEKMVNITSSGHFSKKAMDQLARKVGASDIKKTYSLKERVGKGGFGSVYAARHNTSKVRVAIKKLPHRKSKERKMNVREIRVLEFCKHPNIIAYHESYIVHDEAWVSMEFMEGGTLSEASAQYPFQESNIAYVAREMLIGIHYLHTNHFVHRDLKSQNIMLTPVGEIKLIDFGLCSNLSSGPKIRMCGSPLWMPPEMIQQTFHGYSADIWSLGVCLLELANRAHKHRKDPIRTMFMVATEGFKEPFEDPNRWGDSFHDFISLCLQFDPSKRPTAAQLLSHPFIHQADTKKKMAKILSSIFLKNIVGI